MQFSDEKQETGYQNLIRKIFKVIQQSNSTRIPDTYDKLQEEKAKLPIVNQWLTTAALNKEGRYNESHDTIDILMERWLLKCLPEVDWSHIKDNDSTAWSRLLSDVSKLIHVEVKAYIEKLDAQKFEPELPDFLRPKQQLTDSPAPQESLLLSETVTPYTEHKRGNNPKLGQGSIDGYKDSVADAIFILGDKPVSSISFEDAQRFRDTMRKLPTNRNKIKELIGKSCEELTTLNLPEDKLYSTATISDKIGYLKGIFNWLVATKKIPHNPFELVKIEVTKKSWSEYSQKDLIQIFSSPLYDPLSAYYKKKTTTPSHWWLPLLMLFTGARPGELLQLTLTDFKEEKGVLFADLTDEEESKKIKTKAGKRKVPIHQQLLDIGIKDYIAYARNLNQERFFSDLSIEQRKPSAAASKWFNERYRKSHLPKEWKNQKKALYSFRCTHITEALNQGVDQRLLQLIVGHEPSQMGATKHYDRGASIQQLKSTIDQVTFNNLNLNHLKNGWEKLMR